jgi:hypothetical protein
MTEGAKVGGGKVAGLSTIDGNASSGKVPPNLITYAKMELSKKANMGMSEADKEKNLKGVIAKMTRDFGNLERSNDIMTRVGGLSEGTKFTKDELQKELLDDILKTAIDSHNQRPNMPAGFGHIGLHTSGLGVPERLLADHAAKKRDGVPAGLLADYPDIAAKYGK